MGPLRNDKISRFLVSSHTFILLRDFVVAIVKFSFVLENGKIKFKVFNPSDKDK